MELEPTPDELVIGGEPDALRDEALRRLKARRDFKAHAFAYLLINLVVWTVWLIIGLNSGSWWPWPVFVTLGWGIGFAFNAWDVYLRKPITEADVASEIEKLQVRR